MGKGKRGSGGVVRFQRLYDEMLEAWEKDYRAEKAKIMEELHNDLAEVITNHINKNGATVEQVCFVLDALKHELTVEKLKQIYQTGEIAKTLEAPTTISFGKGES